jgi:hypothetical protein
MLQNSLAFRCSRENTLRDLQYEALRQPVLSPALAHGARANALGDDEKENSTAPLNSAGGSLYCSPASEGNVATALKAWHTDVDDMLDYLSAASESVASEGSRQTLDLGGPIADSSVSSDSSMPQMRQ